MHFKTKHVGVQLRFADDCWRPEITCRHRRMSSRRLDFSSNRPVPGEHRGIARPCAKMLGRPSVVRLSVYLQVEQHTFRIGRARKNYARPRQAQQIQIDGKAGRISAAEYVMQFKKLE